MGQTDLEKCVSCRFVLQTWSGCGSNNHCRRYPPKREMKRKVVSAQQDVMVEVGVLPPVEENGWCGEFQSRYQADNPTPVGEKE